MTFTPYTLAEYDAVLSVSEEAINKQMEELWNMKIDPPKDDHAAKPKLPLSEVPGHATTKVEGHASPPRSYYMINHDISIHALINDTDDEGNVKLDDKGNPLKIRSSAGK
jgi:hypothetical protein